MNLSPPAPALRQDLHLSEAAPGADGTPAWVIQDAVVNRFYRIGWLEFEFLLRWGKPSEHICAEISRETSLKPDQSQLQAFRQFLEYNDLLVPTRESTERQRRQISTGSWLDWHWWLHHYLFFRIPLVRPQRWLARLSAHLSWLFTPATAFVVAGLSAYGIVLTLQQWDVFTHAVVESFSTDGLLSFALALIVAKTLHEMAHALTATRFGLRVAHMGIAFVVLWPMLYTDTGESWKLRSAKQRLAIASAGIVCELSLAGLATLVWALADPGPWRNAALYLATTSWILSLALNASPFMRFDGYFILSDLLDFPNLHQRASALTRTALRRSLLGLDEAWPEIFPARQRRLLIAFELGTWIYRFFVFLGIAITVYLYFFKALGILLFVVEVSWFIAMPIIKEIRYWWAHRAAVPANRRHLFMLLAGLGLLILCIPWRSQIPAEGMARAERQLRVFPPFAARLQTIKPAGPAAVGEQLLEMDEPNIRLQLQGSEAGARGYQARLAGLLADHGGLDQQSTTRERVQVQQRQISSARSEIARLQVHAPFAGIWTDVDPELKPGQWVGPKDQIGILLDPSRWQVDAYVEQDNIEYLEQGSRAHFYPHGSSVRLSGTVVDIGTTQVHQLANAMLASRTKGPIPVTHETNSLTPIAPLFHVLIQLDEAPPVARETRGQLQIEGKRRSLLLEWSKKLFSALIRQTGF